MNDLLLYFSATGNTKWISDRLAEKLDDRAIDIMSLTYETDINNKLLVLLFPVYAWGVPEPFLKKLGLITGTPHFCSAIATCGADVGEAFESLPERFCIKSEYSIAMPNNYIIGSDTEDADMVYLKLNNAKEQIDAIASEIRSEKEVRRLNKGKFSHLKSHIINPAFNAFARSAKGFCVTETCNSCGQCENNCPAGAISLVHGKPVWQDKCYMCTSCINRCPTQAIEYGIKTKDRKRYYIEKYI